MQRATTCRVGETLPPKLPVAKNRSEWILNLYKVHEWEGLMNHVFGASWEAGRDLSFDEMIVAALHRWMWRVFMKDKPTRRGYKRWAICEALKRCCIRVSLYCGDRDDLEYEDLLGKLGGTVLAEIKAAGLLNKGHHFCGDRAFSNLYLGYILRLFNTTWTGTINANRRGLPNGTDTEVSNVRGDSTYAVCTVKVPESLSKAVSPQTAGLQGRITEVTICLAKMKDTKEVTFMSTEVG